MIETSLKIMKIYREAINQIDDYFEYRNESKRDKEFVMGVLDGIADKIKTLNTDTDDWE